MRFSTIFGLAALATAAYTQSLKICESGACYAINVPSSTASNHTNDIFFQITGSSTNMSWVGLGQGAGMKGANIFVIYANEAGTNVTLSPRMGVGHTEPRQGSVADVELLSGSGIAHGIMTANIKCSNCNRWSGGAMNFSDVNSDWIWAFHSGTPVSSDELNVNLPYHTSRGTINFNLQLATGGSTPNPFIAPPPISHPASGTGSSNSSGLSATSNANNSSALTSSSSSSWKSAKKFPSDLRAVKLGHGILMSLSFAIFMPLGAIAMRTLSFKGLIWVHAGWMVFAYIMALAAAGMGIWLSVLFKNLDSYHAVIGLFILGCLLIQPVTGVVHHLLYKKTGGRTASSYAHLWWGRAIVTLAIINGGLGLQLAMPYQPGTETGLIVYGVVAGVIWLVWMAVIAMSVFRTKDIQDEKRKSITDSDEENKSTEQLTRERK